MAKRKRKPARPRDPTWRTRRALGVKRVESARTYARTASRRAEREAAKGDGNGEES